MSNVAVRYSQGVGLDEPLAEFRASSPAFYELDGLGTVSSLTSQSGTVADSYEYGSFGTLVSSAMTLGNSLQYTARQFDAETGLLHYRARYYSADVGRFLGEDPIHFAGGMDFYEYVGNHPINFSDPLGLAKHQSGAATAQYNCLAWGLGYNYVWIQPSGTKSPNVVFPHFGCKEINCSDPVSCKLRHKVEVFEDTGDSTNWHVERQTCDKGWTSKYGKAPMYDGIDNPETDYINEYGPVKGKLKKKCWSCPADPPFVLPDSPDISHSVPGTNAR